MTWEKVRLIRRTSSDIGGLPKDTKHWDTGAQVSEVGSGVVTTDVELKTREIQLRMHHTPLLRAALATHDIDVLMLLADGSKWKITGTQATRPNSAYVTVFARNTA